MVKIPGMIKKGKEIKMGKTYKDYKVVSGTVDSKSPTSVYINISAWGEPTDENTEHYIKVINGLKKRIRTFVHNQLSLSFNKQRTIIDLDMRESGIAYGKRSYMSCEITLYQNNMGGRLLMSDELKLSMKILTDELIEEVFDKDPHFKFNKKKN